MTVGQAAAARPSLTVSIRSTADAERRAFNHEHIRLYEALEHAAQIAELAGHDILAASLRRDRRDIADEINAGDCPERPRRPSIVLVSDDVDEDGQPNEWNGAGMARAAGERGDE